MQAAPTRYASASELYCADEVELLLDEIRELEPTSCRGEDVQDFEIAGSGGGGGSGAGGRSPAGTELTERSWDSHAHYSRAPPPRPRALAPVYCHWAHLRSARGALGVLLALLSAAACGCVWAAAGLRAGAARPLLFGALTSLMLHALRAALHVTRLHRLLPLDWNRLGGASFLWSALWLTGGAAALLARVGPADRPPAQLLFAAAMLGLCGAALALAGCALAVRAALAGPARAPPDRAYRALPTAPPAPAADRAL
ncbi:uncharacterized protein LOC128199207 [Bicyclus anynana]|uniref:Uncharacterized protein LOC128199207 n=1 Tax=Bicyclus anynana TaxID=110368 RepID=A0ABM3LX31_BICAN|nr:uncharacterized protein LOC128199207 [Bicyclus anynana]